MLKPVIRDISGQYNGCWCPGSLHFWVINNHGIDCVWLTRSLSSTRKIFDYMHLIVEKIIYIYSFLWMDQQHRTGNIFFILLNTKTCVLPLCTAQRCAFPSHPSRRRQHTNLPSQYISIKVPISPRVKTIEYYRGPSPPTVGCHWTAPMPCLHKAKI